MLENTNEQGKHSYRLSYTNLYRRLITQRECKGLGKMRTSPRTALAYRQIRVQGIQMQEGWLPFKTEYPRSRVCPKAPKGGAGNPICFVTALAKDDAINIGLRRAPRGCHHSQSTHGTYSDLPQVKRRSIGTHSLYWNRSPIVFKDRLWAGCAPLKLALWKRVSPTITSPNRLVIEPLCHYQFGLYSNG